MKVLRSPTSPETLSLFFESADSRLDLLSADYCKYSECRARLDELNAALRQESASTADQSPRIEQMRAVIEDELAELYSLSWRIAEAPSTSLEELKLKALLVLDNCEQNTDDLLTALASSLAFGVIGASQEN